MLIGKSAVSYSFTFWGTSSQGGAIYFFSAFAFKSANFSQIGEGSLGVWAAFWNGLKVICSI